MLFLVKERLASLNYNTDFLGEGGAGYIGGWDRYIYFAKKGHFMAEVSRHFRPSL